MNRFWKKVDKSGDCWEWTAAKNRSGYGRFGVNGINKLAHRVVMGDPEGKCVLHHCDNPGCVNPDHLYIGDHADNAHDRSERGRGSHFHYYKLGAHEVLTIRSWYARGGHSYRTLSKIFGVTKRCIGDIIINKTWNHVGG